MKTFDAPKSRCEICGAENIFPYHQDHKGIRIFKCASCKIQFMNPQYSDAYLTEYYAAYTIDEPKWDEPSRYCHNFYLSLVEKYASSRGRLLDIGAGRGDLLAVAKERGWAPVGYDVDLATTQKVGKAVGVEILSGDFTKINWGSQVFDLITMHHVLEHLKSPVPYLNIIHTALRPHGILFIVLPNVRSISSTGKFYLEKLKIRRRRVGAYYDTSHHMWYYTPLTLKRMLSRFGFDVLHMRSGHQARPNQSAFVRAFRRNVTERVIWKSTFLVIAQRKS